MNQNSKDDDDKCYFCEIHSSKPDEYYLYFYKSHVLVKYYNKHFDGDRGHSEYYYEHHS